jgi:hypothetical protein
MKRSLVIAIVTLAAAPAWAQSSNSTGVGVGVANSTSAAGAVAIGGGNANAAGGRSKSISNAQQAITLNSNTPSEQTIKNVPTAFAPGLTAAGLETCLGSVSGGGAFVGTGFSFGTTIPDPGCAARLDARTLWSMGLKKAAVARLCLTPDIARSMPEICYQSPQAAVAAASYETPYPYRGGPIMLVEGKSGQNRLCNDYDEHKQRCRAWANVVSHHQSPKKKVAEVVVPTAASLPTEVLKPLPAEITEGKSQ